MSALLSRPIGPCNPIPGEAGSGRPTPPEETANRAPSGSGASQGVYRHSCARAHVCTRDRGRGI